MNEKIITLKNLRIISEYIKRKISGKANTDHTHTVSTASANGFMSKDDKAKLDGITAGANKYTHPTTSGNKHIPSGGSSGQILRWSAGGTAAWGAENNTTYANMTAASASAAGKAGLVPAPAAGAQAKYLRGDGTWQTPPDTNTTYSAATQSANGLMSAADKKKLDGIGAGANKYTHPTTAGNKHIPAGGSSGQILRWSADGTAAWGAENNTTYGVATQTANGLMSAADKKKLDGLKSGGDSYFLVISDKSSGTGNVASLGASTFSDDPNAASDTVSPNAAIGGGVEISKTMYLNLVKNGTTVVSSIPLNVSGIYGQIVTI